jgi:O-antigen ligase
MKKFSSSQYFQFLTLLCLPLYILRFYVPFLNISLPSTVLEVLILLTALITFWEFRKDLKWESFKSSFDLLIFTFLLAAGISVVVSPSFYGGLGIFRAYFFEPIIFYYCCNLTIKKYGADHIFLGLFLTGVWLSILAILQKFTGQFSLAPQELVQGRVTGTFNSANSLALFLGPLIFLALGFYFKLKNQSKWIYFALVLIFTLCIVWTKSRGGIIGEAVSVLVFGFGYFSLKRPALRKIWFVIPLFVTLVVTIFFYQMFEIYDASLVSVNQNSTDTLQIRFALWEGTANLLKDHPIFGAGLNGFKDLYSSQYKISPDQEDLQYPHNIFLNFWVETGLLGLICFVLILIKSFKTLMNNLLEKDYFLGLGLLCGLSYLLIHGLVDVPYFKNDLSAEFWLIIVLIESWRLGHLTKQNR